MDWYDVDDILYDGQKKDIEQLVCPDCGGKIHFDYSPQSKALQVRCLSCGYLSRQHGDIIPNCYKIFGSSYPDISKEEKAS